MKLAAHIDRVFKGYIEPRVVEHEVPGHGVWYCAWTPTWEGPARPDFPAAAADLRERLA